MNDVINTLGLFDTAEAAEVCGLSITGIKYHISRGHLRPVYRKGRSLLFDRAELERFKAMPLDPRGARRKNPIMRESQTEA